MPSDRHDDITSGFINPTQGEVFASFARRTTIDTPGHNLLVKVEHDGVWRLLKGLKPEYRDQGVYRALLRKEYDIAKHLQYPGVVGTLALIEDAELGPCIVMEWIEGITLGEWMDERHTRAERRDIAHQLIGVVEYLHRMNVVHRDLKPANVMVTLMGNNVIVIDFGLADKPSHALFKQAAGTEGYIPEEQLDEDAKPDARHDIYSLGKILQELKPGGAFAAVIRCCCAPLERRYPSIKALKDDLTRREKTSKVVRRAAGAIIVAALAVMGYRMFNNVASTQYEAIAQHTDTTKTLAGTNTLIDIVPKSTDDATDDMAQSTTDNGEEQEPPTTQYYNSDYDKDTIDYSTFPQTVKEAIEQGIQHIDEKVTSSGLDYRMEHLTMDDWYGNYFYLAMMINGVWDDIKPFSKTFDISNRDKKLVEQTLAAYFEQQYYVKWKKKWDSFPLTQVEWHRQQNEKAKKREAELDER